MKSLSIECPSCRWFGHLQTYQVSLLQLLLSLINLLMYVPFCKEHLDECHRHPKCEFCDQQIDSIEQLNEHKLQQCEKFTVFCPLKQYGCDESVSSFTQ